VKSRLFLKIFAAYSVALLTVLTLDSFFVASQTRQDISRQIKDELIMNGQILRLMPLEQVVKNIHLLSEALKARVTVVNAVGRVLEDSERDAPNFDNHLNRPEIQEARVKGQGSAIRYSQTLRTDMMYVALPVREGEEISGYIRLAKPLQEVKTTIGHFYQIVFRAAVIILTSFLLLALFFIPKFISPILRITTYTTEKARNEGIPGSLMVHSRDEIGLLADNINLLVRKYEDNLRLAFEEREKLEAAFASMVEGIVILNSENRVERVNKGMMSILGDKYFELTGKTPLEVFRNVELQNTLDRYRETGNPVFREISLVDDNPIILNVNIAPIKGLPGGDRKTIMVFHDVTQLRKLERIRGDFVANVTHEIKTPLTAIIGFVQTLQEGAMEDQTKTVQFLQIISEHALRLNRLVDDLLTLSSIELGEKKLHLGEIDIGKAIYKAITIIEKKAKEKGLALHRTWSDLLPPIMADADSIVQILVNVLDNAVKFTPSGSIAISTSLDKTGYLSVMVADTGIGIPAHEIPRLGERFYRVDKMRSRELGGTGLGLSIVKHLLKAQNGWMEVESKPGAGSVVKLFLPICC
jgi:two-component system phosphate regulon sensor histidine kinase PhoR